MTASTGWENENEGLVALFNVEIPEYASAAGKRLLVPAALFRPKASRVLKNAPRKYPVYYHYAFTEAIAWFWTFLQGTQRKLLLLLKQPGWTLLISAARPAAQA